MRNELLYSLLGMYGGMAIYMIATGNYRWSYIFGATTGVLIYFFVRFLLRKKDGTPETDERVRQNLQKAALYTLVSLIGLGGLVLALTTSPDQQIPVRYLSVAFFAVVLILAVVLEIVKRR